ncbi:hypothetical protein [Fictibacillus gelatini]|uniref:hypothetical protein n=1 Tax=Fictibacillus gelatini TaxID=225985 RepID=UPI000405879A|nr:hypothetical protein [Fictibacillus gelatini]
MRAEDAVAGLFFGFIGIVYILVLLFMVVLTIVFIFKAMSFMKRKNESDQILNQNVQRLIGLLQHSIIEKEGIELPTGPLAGGEEKSKANKETLDPIEEQK